MAKLTFNGVDYTVDHAVKGADYVHGYSAEGLCIISIDGITDFSVVTYDGTYLTPEVCFAEVCNDVRYVNGALVRKDGSTVPASAVGAAPAYSYGTEDLEAGVSALETGKMHLVYE